jgi:hypothetical protein
MVSKKTTDGLTEVKAPISSQMITQQSGERLLGGVTEAPRALNRIAGVESSSFTKVEPAPDFIRGLTEAPQAIPRPVTNNQQNTSQEKK